MRLRSTHGHERLDTRFAQQRRRKPPIVSTDSGPSWGALHADREWFFHWLDLHHFLGHHPDLARAEAMAAEITRVFEQGRKVLVLTERAEHLGAIHPAVAGRVPPPFVLHGRMSRKQRAALIAELDALAPQAPLILLAIGKLVGEGFDHPALDTLVLAMPVSWKGTLQQYAGRLHRRTRQQDRCAHHRLRQHRPPGVAADVGQAAAGISRDGVPSGSAGDQR